MKSMPAVRRMLLACLTRQIALGACFAAAALTAIGPAGARTKVFAGVAPVQFDKKWSFDDWHVWAMPGDVCLAMESYPIEVPFRFWGFRQSPGSSLQLYFGSIENARPQTVQMSFNNGGQFDYSAEVIQIQDWDAYAIFMRGNALSVFPRQLTVEASVGGDRVFMNVYNAMGRVRDNMAECLAWQGNH